MLAKSPKSGSSTFSATYLDSKMAFEPRKNTGNRLLMMLQLSIIYTRFPILDLRTERKVFKLKN